MLRSFLILDHMSLKYSKLLTLSKFSSRAGCFSIRTSPLLNVKICTIQRSSLSGYAKNVYQKPLFNMYNVRGFYKSSVHNCNLHQRTCWKCGTQTNPHEELFFCVCGVVQEPVECMTYYELFQMKQCFDIDTKILTQRFKDTQKLLHPDKFSTKSKEERHLAEEHSSLLNKSFDALVKPLSRAIYLLELDKITISENDTLTDPDFLMEVMDEFETISNASSPEHVSSLEENNRLRMEKCVGELSKAFSQNHLMDAKSLTIRLRYYTTIEERIKELKRSSF